MVNPFRRRPAASILVGTPMYGGACFAPYVEGLLDLQAELGRAGVPMGRAFVRNMSLVHFARNTLVAEFLRSPATHLLFIDADIGFRGEDVVEMLRADVDFIGGIYPRKVINWPAVHEAAQRGAAAAALPAHAAAFTTQLLPGTDPGAIPPRRPLEVESIGTGLLLLRRRVFEDLEGDVEVYRREELDQGGQLQTGEGIRAYFTTPIVQGRAHGEDVNFCRLWRARGGKVYAAPWARMQHVGTHVFEGAAVSEGP